MNKRIRRHHENNAKDIGARTLSFYKGLASDLNHACDKLKSTSNLIKSVNVLSQVSYHRLYELKKPAKVSGLGMIGLTHVSSKAFYIDGSTETPFKFTRLSMAAMIDLCEHVQKECEDV